MAGRVFVNTRALQRPTSGVERYTCEVLARLGGRVQRLPGPRLRHGWAGHAWEQFLLPASLNAGDVLWSPANSGPLAVSNQVLTLHDLSVYDHPHSFSPLFRWWHRLLIPRLAGQAEKIITDSAFSRERIIYHLGLPPEKVTVIACGVDRGWFYPRTATEIARVRARYRLPEAYFLFVGSLEARKNLRRLLLAWKEMPDRPADLGLVLAGRSGRAFRRLDLDPLPAAVHRPGYIAEQDLPALYSGARALVLPSRYEGFGLPVLEAMACGTAVLCSRIPALVDTAGPAALLFDPDDDQDMAAALARLVREPELRQDLIQRGRQRARQFSWERTSEQVWAALGGC